MSVYDKVYPEFGAGGFTRFNGTHQFFLRVNALVEPEMVILDFGAGRGGAAQSPTRISRELTNLQGKAAKVIGIDVDPVVEQNPRLDEAIVFDGITIPLADSSVDLIVSDNVFEHIADPRQIADEFHRVLKPGGWVCARTPYFLSLLVWVAKLIPNSLHARLLQRIQPGARAKEDVFPTVYKLNSNRALRRYFPENKWINHSYTFSPEPAYHFGFAWVVRLMQILQHLKAPIAGEMLFVFLRKT